MDALRKAELAKRQARAQHAQAAAAAKTGAEAPSELAIVVESEIPTPGSRPGTQAGDISASPAKADPTARADADRAAAQNLFAAKQKPSRLPLYFGLGVATFLAAGIGYYFWLQLRPVSGGIAPGAGLSAVPGPAVVPAAANPTPPPPSVEPQKPSAASTSIGTAPPDPRTAGAARPADPGAPTKSGEPAKSGTASRAEVLPPMPSDQATRGRMVDEPQPARAEPTVPLRAGAARNRVNAGVAAGYQAFQSGDLAAARQAYEEALRNEPKNSDALHGLAAINLRQGRQETAESLYARALEADPKDALAHSALINLRAQADPVHSESRIKGLLATKPEAPYLHFSLGNLYAREGRWTEAQQSYFRAHAGDPENPDYLFNLAVSLDQMRQRKLALQYYQNALTAATTRSAAFDPSQAQARIRDLLE